jgi:hypothetical protein
MSNIEEEVKDIKKQLSQISKKLDLLSVRTRGGFNDETGGGFAFGVF